MTGTGASEPTLLEIRYRRALRMLPEDYRAAWGEDMVTSLLDARGVGDPDPEQDELAGLGKPGPAEVLSVLLLAVRARLGAFGASPRQARWGEAARRVALVGLLVAAADVLARGIWEVAVLHDLPTSLGDASIANPGWLFAGPWRRLLALAPALWAPAFAALVFGRRRTAAALAVLAVLPELLRTALDITGFPGITATLLAFQIARLAPVVALIAFHDGAPAPRPRPWLVALAVATATLLLPAALIDRGPGALPPPTWVQLVFADWAGVCAIAAVTAAVVHLVARRRGHRFGSARWTLALFVITALALLQRGVSVADYVRLSSPEPGGYRVFEVAALVETVLLATVAVVLATLARDDLHETRDSPAPMPGAGPSVTA
jgi:hypothetical protein